MPFRRLRPPTDLERVARILGSGAARGTADEPGWVPDDPGRQTRELVGRVSRLLDDAAPEVDDVARLDADLRGARRPPVLSMPDQLRAGRRSVSSAAVVALLALVVAVGCVFVLRVLWAERSAGVGSVVAHGDSSSVEVQGAPTALGTGGWPSVASTARGPSGAGTSGAAPGGGPTVEVVVHVVGQVGRPGLVRLKQGARVADAVAAAGGARRGADLGLLNLARFVVDGEQIHVPAPGEAAAAGPAGSAGSVGSVGGAGGAGASAGGGSPGSTGGEAMVSLNTADTAALDTLPGVGPVLAQRILDWRTEHGRFASVDELAEVSGIGDKLMAQLRPRVTL